MCFLFSLLSSPPELQFYTSAAALVVQVPFWIFFKVRIKLVWLVYLIIIYSYTYIYFIKQTPCADNIPERGLWGSDSAKLLLLFVYVCLIDFCLHSFFCRISMSNCLQSTTISFQCWFWMDSCFICKVWQHLVSWLSYLLSLSGEQMDYSCNAFLFKLFYLDVGRPYPIDHPSPYIFETLEGVVAWICGKARPPLSLSLTWNII